MSVKEIKALERRYYELVNKGDLTACFELCATDLVLHSSLGETRGLEENKKISKRNSKPSQTCILQYTTL